MLTSNKCLTALAFALATFTIGTTVVAAEELDCTVTHPTTNKFYDLRPLIRKDSDEDWIPDTGNNKEITYKLNVCHKLLYAETGAKEPGNIASWGKLSKGKSYGEVSAMPIFRGDNLILRYGNGDQCIDAPHFLRSTVINFVCDTTVSGQGNPVLLSNEEECHLWYEWRTPVACPATRTSGGGASGGGIFGTIIGVAVAVYFIGGIAYNRVVHNARGFKQIPNYHWWYEAFDFIKDMVIILFAKCYRPKRSQSSYHNLPVDSEINTLIDDDYEDDEV